MTYNKSITPIYHHIYNSSFTSIYHQEFQLFIIQRHTSSIAQCQHLPYTSLNNFSNIMGGCAGCMGPNRRANNYQVNRLTENSPIKNRVSVSQLPASRNKDRIMEELNESKRKYEQGNLISTLINSPVLDKPLSRITRHDSPQLFIRDSFAGEEIGKTNGSGMLRLRKVESNSFMQRKPQTNSFIDQNHEKYMMDKPLFVSQFRGQYERPNSKVLAEIRLNKNGDGGIGLKKKGLSNIPQLADEQSKTPGYVKQIRKQNGEDVKPTSLDAIPRQLQPAPRMSLLPYLKDLL